MQNRHCERHEYQANGKNNQSPVSRKPLNGHLMLCLTPMNEEQEPL
jgi:hypothetical protein